METRRKKMNSKIFSRKIFLSAAAVFLAAPALIMAEGQPAAGGEDAGKNFCQKFESAVSKIDQKIASLESGLVEKRAQTSNKISQTQSERDQKLSESRSGWDAKRNGIYAKLESKAGTDEQKQAIAAFKVEIEQAVAARQAAVDKATADFRDGLKISLENRKSKVDELFLNYKKEIGSAFETARSSCQSGTVKKTVREDLLSDLRSVREKFSMARQEAMMAGFEASNLQVVRRSTVDMAAENFKFAFEAAKEKLRSAFPDQDI